VFIYRGMGRYQETYTGCTSGLSVSGTDVACRSSNGGLHTRFSPWKCPYDDCDATFTQAGKIFSTKGNYLL